MDLIRHADTATAMPAPTAGIPPNGTADDKPGWFVDCDLESGVLGTPILSQWANGLQAEIINTIVKSGLTPDYGRWDQLGDAIEKMITQAPLATTDLAGKVELATEVEAINGVDVNRAVTPAGLAGALLAGRGWRANRVWAAPGTFALSSLLASGSFISKFGAEVVAPAISVPAPLGWVALAVVAVMRRGRIR